jgi:hypothetical protein
VIDTIFTFFKRRVVKILSEWHGWAHDIAIRSGGCARRPWEAGLTRCRIAWEAGAGDWLAE